MSPADAGAHDVVVSALARLHPAPLGITLAIERLGGARRAPCCPFVARRMIKQPVRSARGRREGLTTVATLGAVFALMGGGCVHGANGPDPRMTQALELEESGV